jgi:hypothetical protein
LDELTNERCFTDVLLRNQRYLDLPEGSP